MRFHANPPGWSRDDKCGQTRRSEQALVAPLRTRLEIIASTNKTFPSVRNAVTWHKKKSLCPYVNKRILHKIDPLNYDCRQRSKRMSKCSMYSDPWGVFMFPKLKISFNGYNLLLCNDIQGRGIKSSGTLCRTDRYSRINNTKSPASGAGNVRKPRLMSPIRESARSRVRVGQCVSAVWMVEVPVLVCLRRRCNHMTEVRGPKSLRDSLGLCGCNPAINRY
jgi:hypothetical protein